MNRELIELLEYIIKALPSSEDKYNAEVRLNSFILNHKDKENNE